MGSINLKPIVSEKSAAQVSDNKYVVYVDPATNKIELKKYIESKFNVTVEAINILNVKGKKRRRGRIEGRMKDRKKAVITIKQGDEIEAIKTLF